MVTSCLVGFTFLLASLSSLHKEVDISLSWRRGIVKDHNYGITSHDVMFSLQKRWIYAV